MVKTDPFLEMINKKNDEKKQKFKDALLFGKSEAHTDSGRRFVQSCQEQFDKKGYLTPRQVEALFKVDSEPPCRSSYHYDDDYDEWEYGDFHPSDFAGGDPSW